MAYASKHGSTAEIAEKIGEVLRGNGHEVTIQTAKDMSQPENYDKVILGTSLYLGRYHREAARFLKQHVDSLSTLPVWIFMSGPTGPEDPILQLKGWRYPNSLKPIMDHIQPQQITCFGGKIDTHQLNAMEGWLINRIKAPVGDFRNWENIIAWAEMIAHS